MSRERLVSKELNPRLARLPSKFSTIHDHQIDAVMEIVEAYLDHDEKVVVLEAPTGSGKTLIAELVRGILDTRASYVCHNKDLQTQFSTDFPYSAVLYGRANYGKTDTGLSCDDCTWRKDQPQCVVCYSRDRCPYQLAKGAAIRSTVPVLNSSYWLNEVQAPRSRFANTGLTVFDEADTLEQVLMNQVEVYVSGRSQDRYGIRPPAKVTVVAEFSPWCEHALGRIGPRLEQLANIDFNSVEQARELKRLVNLHSTISAMKADLELGIPWVYTGGAGRKKNVRDNSISFKPVKVDRFGAARIWDHDKRFLLMSATIVSPQQLLRDLGWTGSYRYVTVESQFHARNRQVVVNPIADMTRKGMTDESFTRMANRVSDIVRQHSGERCVVHAVSYSLTDRVVSALRRDGFGNVFSYSNAASRATSLERYLHTPGAIIVAPSLDRGVDLPGDLCRVQVICKVPYLSLGDKQVTERLYNTPDGKVWYNVEVARTIMQMVGRGVRNTEDYCECYILDSTFAKWYRSWGHLFPKWFRRAIRFEEGQ